MVLPMGVAEVQHIILYEFKVAGWLVQALTAAGADSKNYDGNRTLAQLGEYIIQFVLAKDSFIAGSARGDVSKKVSLGGAKANREGAAKTAGIDGFIRCSPRQGCGPPSRRILSRAVSAIVGASFIDSGENLGVARQVIRRLGIATPEEVCLDPRILSIEQNSPFLPKISASELPSDAEQNRRERDDKNPELFHDWIEDDVISNTSGSTQPYATNNFAATQAVLPENAEIQQMATGISSYQMDAYSSVSPGDRSVGPWESNLASDADPEFSMNLDELQDEQQNSSVDAKGYDRFEGADNSIELVDVGQQHIVGKRTHDHQSSCDVIQDQEVAKRASIRSPGSQTQAETANPIEGRIKNGPTSSHGSHSSSWQAGQNRRKSDKGKETSVTRKSSKKGGRRGKRVHEKEAALESYISGDGRKYKESCLPCPEARRTDDVPRESRIKSLGLEKHTDTLEIFVYTIGDCNSVIVLKDVLRAYRENGGNSPANVALDLSNAQRVEAIESLGGNVAYSNLLRMFHIHKLFTDNSDPVWEANGNFILSTAESIAPRVRRQLGNPLHAAEAGMTKSMMQDTYPNLQLESTEYRLKYRRMSALRRIGRRLNTLVNTFGFGVLGLLPLANDLSTAGLASSITNSMISHLPDGEFNNAVIFLDECRGEALRQISKAATQIVEGIGRGAIDPSERFTIEHAERTEILRYANGSSQLLNLFSPDSTSRLLEA